MRARNLIPVTSFCFACLLTAAPRSAGAAEPAAEAGALDIATIMQRDWIGTLPENSYWSDDGKSIYFSQRRPGSDIADLHRIDVGSGRSEVVPPTELGRVDGPDGSWSRDRKVKAFVREGDLFVRESGRKTPRQLTRTAESESAPLVLADGRSIAFRRGDDFHAIDLATGLDSTLAELHTGKDPDAPPAETEALQATQLRLFTVLAERKTRKEALREESQTRRAADPTRTPAPFYLGEKRVILSADLSPSGRHLLVALGPERDDADTDAQGAEGGKADSMPVFVTESGYVDVRKIRPKVGTGKLESPTLLLLDLVRHAQTTLDLAALPGIADDPLAELRQAAVAARSAVSAAPQAGESAAPGNPSPASPPASPQPRPVELASAVWSEDGARVAVQLFSRDNKDRWLAIVDAASAVRPALAPVHHESDPAWLGWRFTDFGWMTSGRELWFLSESTGFGHLYVQGPGGARRALTQGPFEVDKPRLARDGKSFFVSANREAPGVYEAYRVGIDGAGLERLTSTSGMTYAVPSPDEKQLLLTSSWPTRPPQLFLQAARAGAVPKALTSTVSPAFSNVAWSVPEIVQIRSTHWSGNLQARVYTPAPAAPAAPATSDARPPAVVFIHGAGYLQNAHAGWSDYFHEFMFHTLLTRAGYVVLDLDYRASSGYGRDFRTAIYRQMGEPELDDLADGVAWLIAQRGVDPQRIGAYGGSYGGFLTMMALFKRPELFAAGAALRPVTDWAHYNHGYTSSILNTPEVDPEAYRRSSPIEYAGGLAKPLLICHGMVDDNVAFQDSVRLVQRLIELGKTDNFETAIYPLEPHGFKEPSSWTDEYKRIFRLFETHLK